jgi:hypothetical protein
MDSFFDTSVIIHYGSFSKLVNVTLIKKCYEYIINKEGEFLLGYYIEEEVKTRIKKRRVIFQEALNKIINSSYEFESSKEFNNLKDRDKMSIKKLYEKYKNSKPEEVKKILSDDQSIFEIRIDRFLKFLVNIRIIKIDEIKQELVSIVKENGYSHADCLVLTSALQAQEKRTTFYFVVADEHFNPNGYNFLKGDSRLKDIKFPSLKNFLFEK